MYPYVICICIFEVKLTFEILTVCGQQHSFSTHQRVFLRKCESFRDRDWLDLRGTRIPNLQIHAEWSNHLSYQGQTFAVLFFSDTGSGSTDIFQIKLTFETLTVSGQQHSFLTHERMFLIKRQSSWNRKCLDLRGTRTPNLRIHAECSNHSSYQGQTFAVPHFCNMHAACMYVVIFYACVYLAFISLCHCKRHQVQAIIYHKNCATTQWSLCPWPPRTQGPQPRSYRRWNNKCLHSHLTLLLLLRE